LAKYELLLPVRPYLPEGQIAVLFAILLKKLI